MFGNQDEFVDTRRRRLLVDYADIRDSVDTAMRKSLETGALLTLELLEYTINEVTASLSRVVDSIVSNVVSSTNSVIEDISKKLANADQSKSRTNLKRRKARRILQPKTSSSDSDGKGGSPLLDSSNDQDENSQSEAIKLEPVEDHQKIVVGFPLSDVPNDSAASAAPQTHRLPSKDEPNLIQGEKQYACGCCDYRTKVRGYLSRHMLTHTGEKRYACDSCDYRAGRLCGLKRHAMTHTEERPFACDSCDYRTRQLVHLRRHKRTHTEEMPFACDSCDYRSRTLTYLQRHALTHLGLKSFVACDVCDYRAKKLTQLRKHMLTHAEHRDQSVDPLRLTRAVEPSFEP